MLQRTPFIQFRDWDEETNILAGREDHSVRREAMTIKMVERLRRAASQQDTLTCELMLQAADRLEDVELALQEKTYNFLEDPRTLYPDAEVLQSLYDVLNVLQHEDCP